MQNWNKFGKSPLIRNPMIHSPFINDDEKPSIIPPPGQDFWLQQNGDFWLQQNGDAWLIIS